MEFAVGAGTGYVAAERHHPDAIPAGFIPIDCLYSPVKKVSYTVATTRQGHVLDYDRLVITIESDGSISGDDAAATAARIFREQLAVFINFDEPEPEVAAQKAERIRHQSSASEAGGRVRAFGAFDELPEGGQHCLYRRSGDAHRSADASHAEFRTQIIERDQGLACHHGFEISAWRCRSGRQTTSRIWSGNTPTRTPTRQSAEPSETSSSPPAWAGRQRRRTRELDKATAFIIAFGLAGLMATAFILL